MTRDDALRLVRKIEAGLLTTSERTELMDAIMIAILKDAIGSRLMNARRTFNLHNLPAPREPE